MKPNAPDMPSMTGYASGGASHGDPLNSKYAQTTLLWCGFWRALGVQMTGTRMRPGPTARVRLR